MKVFKDSCGDRKFSVESKQDSFLSLSFVRWMSPVKTHLNINALQLLLHVPGGHPVQLPSSLLCSFPTAAVKANLYWEIVTFGWVPLTVWQIEMISALGKIFLPFRSPFSFPAVCPHRRGNLTIYCRAGKLKLMKHLNGNWDSESRVGLRPFRHCFVPFFIHFIITFDICIDNYALVRLHKHLGEIIC